MTFVFILFIFYCLITARYFGVFSDKYNEAWLNKENTSMVNGVFVVLVFLAHFSGYVQEFYAIDAVYRNFMRVMAQCVVCSFLLYSGYGLGECIKERGNGYLKTLITKRFPSLLLKFSFCVLLFLLLQMSMGVTFPLKQIFLSFVGWESLGNSNWYIFYMLFAYLAIYISFSLARKWNGSFAVLLLCFVLYTLVLLYFKGASVFIKTSFVLPLGMAISHYKDRVINCFRNRYFSLLFIGVVVYAVALVCRFLYGRGTSPLCGIVISHNIEAVCFSVILLLFTFKVKMQSNVLSFLGAHVFEIYILQRLPMIAFKPLYDFAFEKYGTWTYLVYLGTCVCLTLILSVAVKRIFKQLLGR